MMVASHCERRTDECGDVGEQVRRFQDLRVIAASDGYFHRGSEQVQVTNPETRAIGCWSNRSSCRLDVPLLEVQQGDAGIGHRPELGRELVRTLRSGNVAPRAVHFAQLVVGGTKRVVERIRETCTGSLRFGQRSIEVALQQTNLRTVDRAPSPERHWIRRL